jgi:uncharacterized protein YjbI with pentapeptide repeats
LDVIRANRRHLDEEISMIEKGVKIRPGANLGGADFLGTKMSCANSTRADLSGVSIDSSNLSGVSLTGADLTDADLTGANLAGANLTEADISSAKLVGANPAGTTLPFLDDEVGERPGDNRHC